MIRTWVSVLDRSAFAVTKATGWRVVLNVVQAIRTAERCRAFALWHTTGRF